MMEQIGDGKGISGGAPGGSPYLDAETLRRKRKNRRAKRVIGMLLLIMLAYMLFSNIDMEMPFSGLAVKDTDTCVEVTGPQVMTETRVDNLDIEDLGFQVLMNENKAVLKLRNKDDIEGRVRVVVYCVNGDLQGEQSERLEPGETAVLNFLDVEDCDLDYYIEPEMVRRKTNKTVWVEGGGCS